MRTDTGPGDIGLPHLRGQKVWVFILGMHPSGLHPQTQVMVQQPSDTQQLLYAVPGFPIR